MKWLLLRVDLHLIEGVKTVSTTNKLQSLCMGLLAHIKMKKI